MSGPICPDCDLLAVREIGPNKMGCPICGWEGGILPRKKMRHEMQMEASRETTRQMQLREDGKLTYFRVYLQGTDDQKDEALFELMELMDLDSVDGDDPLRFHIEEKASQKQIEAIKGLKGVREVKLY